MSESRTGSWCCPFLVQYKVLCPAPRSRPEKCDGGAPPRRVPERPRRRCVLRREERQPELDSFEPASLNLLLTWFLRNTTAAMTASAMSATRRMYSTMEAPFSSLANLASGQVRETNRFM